MEVVLEEKEGVMHIVMVTIDIKSEFMDRFITAMLENATSSVTVEPGCFRFDVVRDEQNRNRVYLYEVYKDKAAFDVHVKMPHYHAWRDTVKDWFAAPPVLARGLNLFPMDTDWDKNWKLPK
jgi:autoinducer 2-degrading protein